MTSSAVSVPGEKVVFSGKGSKLAFKFVAPVTVLMILISGLLTFFVSRIARDRLTAALEERAHSLAEDLAYNSELGVLSGEKNMLADLVVGILRQEDVLYVQILEAQNHILYEHEKSSFRGVLQERKSVAKTFTAVNGESLEMKFLSHNFSILEVAAPVFTVKKERSREEIGLMPVPGSRNEAEQRRIGTVRIGISTARIGRTIDSFLKTIGILTIVTIVLIAVVVGLSIFRVVLLPVRNLAISMQRVAGGELETRIPVSGDDEIARLTNSFNRMAASLKAAYEELEDRVKERTKDLQQEVTVRKQAEERIRALNRDLERRAMELQEAVAQLESFSYSISHDLRAPLRAIDGYSRMVLEEYKEKVDDEGRRLLSVIRRNAITMGQLIDDLLAFSRLSRQEIRQSLINMEDLANSVFEELKPGMGENKTEFIVREIPDAYGDVAMMHQVFANLLTNAIKFTSEKEISRIIVGSTSNGSETIYFVKDNGIGFDMEYAGKLFGVFQRLSNAAPFEGTGVGLAIVQGIIQKHGGRVWAEGKLNEGATFYFTIPKRGERK